MLVFVGVLCDYCVYLVFGWLFGGRVGVGVGWLLFDVGVFGCVWLVCVFW